MTKEEKKEQELQTIIQSLTLMDDEFMSAVFQDNLDGTNLVLRIFLNKPELNVHRVIAQHTLTNLQKRGVRLDIHAFGYGKEFDIEIQRAGRGASPKRARYNLSVMDANSLLAGDDFEKLPATYVIFITETDVLQLNEPISFIKRQICGKNIVFEDDSAIVYVNGAYEDESTPLGKLVHDFRCTRAEDMYYPILRERVRYFKEEPEGVAHMCKAIEDFAEKRAEEEREQWILRSVRKVMKNMKVTAKKAMDVLELDAETQKKYLPLL